MTKEDRERQRQLMRVAIPAAICLVTIVAIALLTRAWQQGATVGQVPGMDLRGQWLGMRLASTKSQSAADLGVPPEIKGVLVTDVQNGSPSLLAGLAAGDVVTRVNGKPVTDLPELNTLSSRIDNTRPLQVEFLRAGQAMVASMLPPESVAPATAPGQVMRQPVAGQGGGWLGVGANEPNAMPMRRELVRTP